MAFSFSLSTEAVEEVRLAKDSIAALFTSPKAGHVYMTAAQNRDMEGLEMKPGASISCPWSVGKLYIHLHSGLVLAFYNTRERASMLCNALDNSGTHHSITVLLI